MMPIIFRRLSEFYLPRSSLTGECMFMGSFINRGGFVRKYFIFAVSKNHMSSEAGMIAFRDHCKFVFLWLPALSIPLSKSYICSLGAAADL